MIPLLALLFQPSASVGGSGYGAPAVSYGAPEESYGAPAPAYGAPGYSSRSVSTFYLLHHHIPTHTIHEDEYPVLGIIHHSMKATKTENLMILVYSDNDNLGTFNIGIVSS